MLEEINIEVCSRVIQIHNVIDSSEINISIPIKEINIMVDKSIVRCLNKAAEKIQPDITKLEQYQKYLSVDNLWPPIVADRRIIWGPNFTYRQDYQLKSTHNEILSLLSLSLSTVEELMAEFNNEIRILN